MQDPNQVPKPLDPGSYSPGSPLEQGGVYDHTILPPEQQRNPMTDGGLTNRLHTGNPDRPFANYAPNVEEYPNKTYQTPSFVPQRDAGSEKRAMDDFTEGADRAKADFATEQNGRVAEQPEGLDYGELGALAAKAGRKALEPDSPNSNNGASQRPAA
jgi:hypothetical protein